MEDLSKLYFILNYHPDEKVRNNISEQIMQELIKTRNEQHLQTIIKDNDNRFSESARQMAKKEYISLQIEQCKIYSINEFLDDNKTSEEIKEYILSKKDIIDEKVKCKIKELDDLPDDRLLHKIYWLKYVIKNEKKLYTQDSIEMANAQLIEVYKRIGRFIENAIKDNDNIYLANLFDIATTNSPKSLKMKASMKIVDWLDGYKLFDFAMDKTYPKKARQKAAIKAVELLSQKGDYYKIAQIKNDNEIYNFVKEIFETNLGIAVNKEIETCGYGCILAIIKDPSLAKFVQNIDEKLEEKVKKEIDRNLEGIKESFSPKMENGLYFQVCNDGTKAYSAEPMENAWSHVNYIREILRDERIPEKVKKYAQDGFEQIAKELAQKINPLATGILSLGTVKKPTETTTADKKQRLLLKR